MIADKIKIELAIYDDGKIDKETLIIEKNEEKLATVTIFPEYSKIELNFSLQFDDLDNFIAELKELTAKYNFISSSNKEVKNGTSN